MEIYNTLQDYKNVAKVGDYIALGGNGFLNGLKVTSKSDCYKVTKIYSTSGFVSFKKFGGRNSFTTATEQKIGVVPTKYYNNLPKY